VWGYEDTPEKNVSEEEVQKANKIRGLRANSIKKVITKVKNITEVKNTTEVSDDILDEAGTPIISSTLHSTASESLAKEIERELEIPDPTPDPPTKDSKPDSPSSLRADKLYLSPEEYQEIKNWSKIGNKDPKKGS
jgi:signal recognition particle GTPase